MTRKTIAFILAASALAHIPCLSFQGQASGANPRLVLVISIGQMRFDYLTRFAPLYKGGFRRLLDHGAIFDKAMVRHANTLTSPGNAVILSGRHPSHTGIIADRWYDVVSKKTVYAVDDPKQSPLGGTGTSSSPVNFLGPSLAEVLKKRSPQSKVVSVSLKDRAAILLAGPSGDAAYWYETNGGNFVTSSYYISAVPPWLEKWNAQHFADQFAGKPWTRLLSDEKVYQKFAGPDAVDGEWDRRETRFPHSIRAKPPLSRYYDDFRRTPFADEMTLAVALEALKAHRLGLDESTDILAVGFTASDVIGHTYGADSHEVMDEFLRLDLLLGKFFQELEDSVGLARTLVILTSDHGSLPLVENLQAKGKEAQRASPKDLESAVQQALQSRFPGVHGLIAYYDAPNFYLDKELIREHHLKQADVESAVRSSLMSTGLVEAVYDWSQLALETSSTDPYLQLFRNCLYPPRSPDLMVRLKKYIYLDDRIGGTGHGSPYDYDRHIPIIFMGTGIEPGRYLRSCGPEDIAPTLAKLLGFNYAREKDSRLLLEMMRSYSPSKP